MAFSALEAFASREVDVCVGESEVDCALHSRYVASAGSYHGTVDRSAMWTFGRVRLGCVQSRPCKQTMYPTEEGEGAGPRRQPEGGAYRLQRDEAGRTGGMVEVERRLAQPSSIRLLEAAEAESARALGRTHCNRPIPAFPWANSLCSAEATCASLPLGRCLR